MKKVLALMLVFGTASLANASVIDVVTVGVSDLGHDGTPNNPLWPSETIEIGIILNYNPYPGGWTSYDGYALSVMSLGLEVSGYATLDVPGIYNTKTGLRVGDDLRHHSDFDVWAQSGNCDGTPEGYEPMIVNNAIEYMTGGLVLSGLIAGDENGNPPNSPTLLVWNLFLYCEEVGVINVDLTLYDLYDSTQIADYTDITGNNPYPEWRWAVENDLGDLEIYCSASDTNMPPYCWENWPSGQCHGDCYNDDLKVNIDDFYIFKDSFGYHYPDADYDPCADFDRNGDVDIDDFYIFKDSFIVTDVPGDCMPGGTWPPS